MMNKQQYKEYLKTKEPKTNIVKNCILAFIVGGLICDVGQLAFNIYKGLGMSKDSVSTLTSITMIFIGALLTGLNVYDVIGKYGGAGSIVPITGFANSIVSPAMEFKKEGYIFGVGAKMFLIAGPVLVYGISTSVVVGIIYFILH